MHVCAQVAALQEELNYTHAHYQKVIEPVAGPGWTANLGPIERVGAGAGASESDGLEHPAPSGGETGPSGPRVTILANTKDMTSGAAPALASGTVSGNKSSGQEVRRLEAQLEALRVANAHADDALRRKQMEYDELRDRMVDKGNKQFQVGGVHVHECALARALVCVCARARARACVCV